MGSLLQQSTTKTPKCLDVAREARSRERQSPGPAVLASSSLWDVSTVSSAKATTPRGWELEPPSTWPPSWSTWLLRSSSWQRCPRQQEDQDHPPSPPAGHPQRRGAEQAACRCDHRPGRCPPQHPGCPPPQEVREGCKGLS